jgi:ABC-2 type transport system permease protein
MIRVELVSLMRRRRTWVTIAMLNALPLVVAVLLALTALGPRPGTGPPFLSAVLTDGTLFPLAALGIVLPLFLPIAVAVIAGDSVAGEAQGGTLRYLLIRPVARTRLLVAKLVAVIVFVLVAVLIVALLAYAEGRLLLGDGDPSGTVTSVSGSTLTQAETIQRTFLALGYVTFMMLGGAAIALFLSTVTETGITAALGTIAILIGSTVLLGLDAADVLQPYLPTRYWLAFVDLFRDPIRWGDVVRGLIAQTAYLAVFAGAAWANFATKDIDT